MVKDLAHSLLADDERLVADAMPHVAAGVGGGGGGAWRLWSRALGSAVAATERRSA